MSGGACGGARAFFHLNTKDSVDSLFIYMVWPPRETPFVCDEIVLGDEAYVRKHSVW